MLRAARSTSMPCARVFVQRLAVVLERRVHRRHLRDRAGEATAGARRSSARVSVHRPLVRAPRLRGRRWSSSGRASSVARVALVGVEAGLRELGRRAEAQRQQARRERVERAGVAGLLGAQQALGLLQRVVARQAQRLVEQQHAVHGAPLRRLVRGAFTSVVLAPASRWPARSARSGRRHARSCGRTGNAASARCGSAGA